MKLIKGWCKLELASVYTVCCFPNHCVVAPWLGKEVGWGAYEFGPRNRILVTQMVKFLWIFEIVNFYEINNFVSVSFSFLHSFIV